jgi:hypothetical protein
MPQNGKKYMKCQKLACAADVRDTKTFRRWSLRGGHPDKCAELDPLCNVKSATEEFQEMSDCREADMLCGAHAPVSQMERKTEKTKTPWYKKWWIWALVLVFIILIIVIIVLAT